MSEAFILRKELADKAAYLQLNAAIMKEISSEPIFRKVKEFILAINNLVMNPSDPEVLEKAPKILSLITPLCETASKLYPPKKPISEIADAYNKYCRENPGHNTEYGFYYGWLSELIDCSSLYRKSTFFLLILHC